MIDHKQQLNDIDSLPDTESLIGCPVAAAWSASAKSSLERIDS